MRHSLSQRILNLVGAGLVACLAACGDAAPIERVESVRDGATAAAPRGPYDLAASEDGDEPLADQRTDARVAASRADDDLDEEGARAPELVVRVLDQAGAPVPGAKVHTFEPRLGEEALVQHEFDIGLDSRTFLERRGSERTADRDGLLRLPPFERTGRVGASAPGLWGSALVDADATEVVLVLEPTQSLVVRVVALDGSPRERVPVVLHRHRRGEVRDLRTVVTEGDGLAEFGQPGELFARTDRDRDWEWRVALAVPLFEPVFAAVDPAALPSEPVELVLPPTARLRVELVEADGEPFLGAGRLTANVSRSNGRAPFEHHVQGQPVVVLEHVEPGVNVELGFQREGSPMRHRITVAAPLVADIETTVRFPLVAEHPVVIARLVDDDDEPLAERRVEFRLVDVVGSAAPRDRRNRDGGRDTGTRYATTDASGRLIVDLPGEWAGRPAALSGSAATLPTPSDTDALVLSGVFQVPAPLVGGANDVGKVRLSPPPVLVDGTVVDELGVPVADVDISVHLRTVDAEGREQWPRVPDLDAVTGPDGRFSIAAWSPGTPLALRPSTRDHVRSENVLFDPGTRGLVVTLVRAGRIAGKLALPAGLDPRRFEVGAAPAGVEPTREALGRASLARTTARRGDAEFELTRLLPGSYTVWVAYTDLPRVLFVAGEVLVQSAETTRDARLDPVDLRSVLEVFDLRFLEPDGDRAGNVTGRWRVSGSESWRDFSTERGGDARIVADGSFIDVEAITRGVAPTRFDGVANSGELVFDPALEVAVRIDRDLLPDFQTYRMLVRLEPVGWSGGRTTAELDEDGRGTFASAGPGTYTVVFVVQRRTGGGRRAERAFAAEPREVVELGLQSGVIELRPKLPRARLESALGAIR